MLWRLVAATPRLRLPKGRQRRWLSLLLQLLRRHSLDIVLMLSCLLCLLRLLPLLPLLP